MQFVKILANSQGKVEGCEVTVTVISTEIAYVPHEHIAMCSTAYSAFQVSNCPIKALVAQLGAHNVMVYSYACVSCTVCLPSHTQA